SYDYVRNYCRAMRSRRKGPRKLEGPIVGRYDIIATCTYLSMDLSYKRTVIHTHTGMQTASERWIRRERMVAEAAAGQRAQGTKACCPSASLVYIMHVIGTRTHVP